MAACAATSSDAHGRRADQIALVEVPLALEELVPRIRAPRPRHEQVPHHRGIQPPDPLHPHRPEPRPPARRDIQGHLGRVLGLGAHETGVDGGLGEPAVLEPGGDAVGRRLHQVAVEDRPLAERQVEQQPVARALGQRVEAVDREIGHEDRPPLRDAERHVGVVVRAAHYGVHGDVGKPAALVQDLQAEHVAAELGLVEVALGAQADPAHQRRGREPARVGGADRGGERRLVDGRVALELELADHPLRLLRPGAPGRPEPDEQTKKPGSGKSEAGPGRASKVNRNAALRGRDDRPRNLRPAIDAML